MGTLVGGVVGGAIGALLASGRLQAPEDETLLNSSQETVAGKSKRRPLKPVNSQRDIETARRNLEGKIAQLNDAIDGVRQQLGGINGGVAEHSTNPPASKE